MSTISRSLVPSALGTILCMPLAVIPCHAQSTDVAVDGQPSDLKQQVETQRARIEAQQLQLDQQRQQIESLAEAIEAQRGKDAAPTGANVPATAARQFRFAGYADIAYQRYDFFENVQDTTPDPRGRTDLQRFVLVPTADLGGGWGFFGEIEFEHGGTGVTVEYEPEEAGEFETEVEKGGEIILEQLFLQYSHSALINYRVGELLVPIGMVNTYHQPTQYFTIERSIAETDIMPVVWHETGMQLLGSWNQWRYQLMVVTALDSTGFSGFEFVRGGVQRRLEYRNADAFALVAQLEYAPAPGVLFGGAFYSGDSAANRPRDNLDVSAQVNFAELHGRYEVGPVTVRAQALVGTLENAEAVTEANLNTFNGDELGTSRTPVGSRATSYFIEAGYDVLSLFDNRNGHRLDVFARYDDYDTHAATEGAIVRNPRYHRQAQTVGANYKPYPGVVFKGEYSYRTHDGETGNEQDIYGLGVGFEF